jgi:hypothetical protein
VHLHSRLRRLFLWLACLAAGGLAAAPDVGHARPGAAAQGLGDICSAGQDAPTAPGGPVPHCAQGLPCCGAALVGPPPCPAALMPVPAQALPAGRGVRLATRAGRWRKRARAPPV